MTKISEIAHPLIRDGRGQDERNQRALSPDTAPLDGRGTEAVLDFIYQFARQVNYYDEHLERSDWIAFFQNQLPFIIARISRYDLNALTAQYEKLKAGLGDSPNFDQVNLVAGFLVEIYRQYAIWQNDLKPHDASITSLVNNIAQSNLIEPLRQLIAIINSTQYWLDDGVVDISDFQQQWELPSPSDFFTIDPALTQRKSAEQYRIELVAEKLDDIFDILKKSIAEVVIAAPGLLKESLENTTATHEPHVGLLYAFINLLDDSNKQLNDLTGQHLSFFYRDVLGIVEEAAVPDKAPHCVPVGCWS